MAFENIRGADQWAAALNAMIEEAQGATTLEQRTNLNKRLREFIIASRPGDESEIPAVDELDRTARALAEDLLIAELQQRVAAIARRGTELASLQKKFQTATAANIKAARSIRLENLRMAITAATGIVDSFNKVKADLSADPEKETAADGVNGKIDKAIKSVQEVRSTLELLGVPV